MFLEVSQSGPQTRVRRKPTPRGSPPASLRVLGPVRHREGASGLPPLGSIRSSRENHVNKLLLASRLPPSAQGGGQALESNTRKEQVTPNRPPFPPYTHPPLRARASPGPAAELAEPSRILRPSPWLPGAEPLGTAPSSSFCPEGASSPWHRIPNTLGMNKALPSDPAAAGSGRTGAWWLRAAALCTPSPAPPRLPLRLLPLSLSTLSPLHGFAFSLPPLPLGLKIPPSLYSFCLVQISKP